MPADGKSDASARPHAATVSSLQSQDSTEHLIACKPPQNTVKKLKEIAKQTTSSKSITKSKKQSVSSKSVAAGSDDVSGRRRLVVLLGLAQVVLGALLVGAGAMAVVKGAALARVGAGLWAGCVAVVAGVVGVLAGINDCYGLHAGANGRPLLTAFLALSLLCLACGNSAAVLAATGLQRDAQRPAPDPHHTFQDEVDAWSPILTNIALLTIASVHCLVSIVAICHVARRVCPCFRAKQPFDHNQFQPGFEPVHQYIVHVDENKRGEVERVKSQELCKELEGKLQGETLKKKKEEPAEYGSANSKEKLVSHWLGRHQSVLSTGAGGVSTGVIGGVTAARARRGKVRKARKPPHAPLMLLPAHPASTLGRVRAACVLVPPRYATLPLPPPAPFPPAHHPLYYPVHDTRLRRRRSPRAAGARTRREPARERDSQLARSLERIHRKRRPAADPVTDTDLKKTYTGLDRAYAEQFIAVIDESRSAAEHHDSLASASATDSNHSHPDL